MAEEVYNIDNKTWDDWLKANPNLANLMKDAIVVSTAGIKPYRIGWVGADDDTD